MTLPWVLFCFVISTCSVLEVKYILFLQVSVSYPCEYNLKITLVNLCIFFNFFFLNNEEISFYNVLYTILS